MNITITSAQGSIFTHDTFDRITMMTEMGEITILPGHEPLLSVIRPGIMRVDYTHDWEQYNDEYITGGGVLTITRDEIVMVIDSIDDISDLDTGDNIERLKNEAREMLKVYHNEHTTDINAQEAMELEFQYLKYAAMHEFIKKTHVHSGGRR